MTLTAEQQDAIEQPHVIIAYFIEFQFKTATSRVCTFNENVTWGGYSWLGVGSLGSISAIEESDGVESKALTFTLNAADPQWLALAAGSVSEYRDRPAKMYMCPMDSSYQLIDTPQICWRGIMDTVTLGIDTDGNSTISMKCETSAYGLKRRQTLRMNASQAKARHPTETGFDQLLDLMANNQLWLTVRFQKK